MTRCKFTCQSMTKRASRIPDPSVPGGYKNGFVYDAEMTAVTGDTEENKRFFMWSPNGTFRVSCVREDHFEPGKSYYIDVTEAPE